MSSEELATKLFTVLTNLFQIYLLSTVELYTKNLPVFTYYDDSMRIVFRYWPTHKDILKNKRGPITIEIQYNGKIVFSAMTKSLSEIPIDEKLEDIPFSDRNSIDSFYPIDEGWIKHLDENIKKFAFKINL